MRYLVFIFLFFPHQELDKKGGEGERGRGRGRGGEGERERGREGRGGEVRIPVFFLGCCDIGRQSKTVPSLVVVLTIVCRSLRRSIVTIKKR